MTRDEADLQRVEEALAEFEQRYGLTSEAFWSRFQALAAYDRLCHGPLLRGLETEGKIMAGLAAMTDDEVDRVCQTLGRMNLAPFFLGERGPLVRESAHWIGRSLPLIARDWRLLRRVF